MKNARNLKDHGTVAGKEEHPKGKLMRIWYIKALVYGHMYWLTKEGHMVFNFKEAMKVSREEVNQYFKDARFSHLRLFAESVDGTVIRSWN